MSHVAIRAFDDNEQSRTVRLDVCGRARVYRDVGGRHDVVWVDTTPTTERVAPAPASRTAQHWRDEEVARVVEDLRPRIAQCIGTTELELSFVLDAAGRVARVEGNDGGSVQQRICVIEALNAVHPVRASTHG